jgi:diaminopimelate epimerase
MKFTKMHGIGNDYVYVNGFDQQVADPSSVARKISDRHFGIGSDGLILILPSDKADVRMRMFNADGSEGEMCGNGIRCVAKYTYDHGLSRQNPLRVETARGVLTLDLQTRNGTVQQVTVNMGKPHLDLERIPVDASKVTVTPKANEYSIKVPVIGTTDKFQPLTATFVNVGNPHAVIFVKDLCGVDLQAVGPILEMHPAFPQRANIHWAQIISPTEIRMITWERGSGRTMACGTGASAVCVAGVLTGRSERKVLVHLPGGDLGIEWRETDDNVYMTGPAAEVFSGEWQDSAA